MKRSTPIILSVTALVVGLALGLGVALFDRGKVPATGAIRNAKLEVGDKAPEFELYDQTGAKVWLSDFRGQRNVVLAFYPAAWTPV